MKSERAVSDLMRVDREDDGSVCADCGEVEYVRWMVFYPRERLVCGGCVEEARAAWARHCREQEVEE